MSQAAPAFVELIKLEKFSMTWLSLQKLSKPLELLIATLSDIKNIFKPTKCTLYILEKSLQQRLFTSNVHKKNYKRIQLGAHIIYAVFVFYSDFAGPAFKTIEEA